MRVPVAWLRDFVETSASAAQIAEALTSRGMAVDAIEPVATPTHIVVGEVEKLERHPNADRLRVGIVDVGGRRLRIVTGADNVAAKDKVPIALVGATVFEHGSTDSDRRSTKTIAKSALRGVESEGMMCSATELALPGEFDDGIIIMEDDAPVGADFWQAARYGDAVLDVDVPSNRPDCLSIVGLAREAAAALGAPFLEPHLADFAGERPSPIAVEIADAGICRRFVGQYFWGITRRRTPLWLKLRLQASGIRSLSFWIDVSNYVVIETGQPLHFYDAKKINGARLIARAAAAGETVTTLDGAQRPLRKGIPVIADGSGPVGVAGVFGGLGTGIADDTTDLFLEAANFVGPRIRRAAVELGLRTEASIRHEKNLPVELAEFGRRHAAKLLTEAGAIASAVVDAGERSQQPRTVAVRPSRVNVVLGTEWSPADVRSSLDTLGFKTAGDEPVVATIPYWRGDVIEEIDAIEEVARAKGYDSIVDRPAVASPQAIDEGLFAQDSLLAQAMAAIGYGEVITLALQGSKIVSAWDRSGIPFWQDVVKVANPLSDDQRFLRPSLLPGLLGIAARKRLAKEGPLKLFELGHVFRTPSGDARTAEAQSNAHADLGVLEWPSLCAVAAFGDPEDEAAIDARLRQVTGDAEYAIGRLCADAALDVMPKARAYFHPGASAGIKLGARTVCKVGRLHPQLALAYELPPRTYAFFLYLERLPLQRPVRLYKRPPRFPGTSRDIALVVDESVLARELVAAVREHGGPLLESVTAFDEYRGTQVGSGKKSVALAIALRKADSTITDAEADAAIAHIVFGLGAKFKASLRA